MFSGLIGFKGRIGRGTWWFTQLLGLVLIAVWIAIAAAFGGLKKNEAVDFNGLTLTLFIISVVFLAMINVCSTVKRYHDRGKSGWFYLVSFVPLFGGFWQLIECGLRSGDAGPNKFGLPPSLSKDSTRFDNSTAGTEGGKLANIDDDYFARYAEKLALSQAQAAAFVQTTKPGSTRPVFGKR